MSVTGLDLAGLHPGLKDYALLTCQWAERNGIDVTITSVRRTWAKQQALRDNYEWCIANDHVGEQLPDHDCRYPANAPGDSAHQNWLVAGQTGALAFDSVVPDDRLQDWIFLRRYFGWNVPDNDLIHTELPNWRAYTPVAVESR